ncbi:hypothetical protein K3727_10240 [Rhodobacteraceae bacterium M382]|nr:hypothetical protein K3727_10240 [Rhodobacteraceae bacterium M382]
MRNLIAAVALSVSAFAGAGLGAAECDRQMFARNGLFYSPNGDPAEALRLGRIRFGEIGQRKQANIHQFKGQVPAGYRYGGKFYLRSGVGGTDHVLVQPKTHQEAVLIRRISHSAQQLAGSKKAHYVALGRADLPFGRCDVTNSVKQQGLREAQHFIESGQYVLAHSDARELKRAPVVGENFHFTFTGRNGCQYTGRIVDPQGQLRTSQVYTGLEKIAINAKGQLLIEQTAHDVAQVFLPSPAYASLPPVQLPADAGSPYVVSSVEASLFDISAHDNGVCLEIPAPIPTGDLSRWFFGAVAADKKAAIRAAKTGNWRPHVTELHFQQIENSSQSAYVRLQWPSSAGN